MNERPTPRVAHDERGSAVVEFVVLGVLMLVPLIYLVMMMARLQAGSFAVSQAAREAGRAYVTSPVGESGNPPPGELGDAHARLLGLVESGSMTAITT